MARPRMGIHERLAEREKQARRLREYLVETGVREEDTNYGSGVLNTLNWIFCLDDDPPVEMQ